MIRGMAYSVCVSEQYWFSQEKKKTPVHKHNWQYLIIDFQANHKRRTYNLREHIENSAKLWFQTKQGYLAFSVPFHGLAFNCRFIRRMPIAPVGFLNRFDCFGLPCRLFCLHGVHSAHPCYVCLHFLPRFCSVPCGRRVSACGYVAAADGGKEGEDGGEGQPCGEFFEGHLVCPLFGVAVFSSRPRRARRETIRDASGRALSGFGSAGIRPCRAHSSD